MSRWFEFSQNNSGGSFTHDAEAGIGYSVWIEATDSNHAAERAEAIGLYFDGIDDGRDCECCGDRWYRPWRESGDALPLRYGKVYQQAGEEGPQLDWGIPSYIHPLDGPFYAAALQPGA